jgi:hypothetical protein
MAACAELAIVLIWIALEIGVGAGPTMPLFPSSTVTVLEAVDPVPSLEARSAIAWTDPPLSAAVPARPPGST